MVETTVIRTIRVKGTSEGIDKLTGDLNKLAGAQEHVAVVSEQSARRSLSIEQAYKKLVMQVDENARAQDRMARAQKDADNAVAQGFATREQANRNLDLLAQKYGLVDAAARKMVAGMSAAGDVGAVASQRMVAGLSAVGKAADDAAKAQAAAAAAGPSRLVAGMSAAGDVNAVASQRMLAGMGAGAQQAAQGIGLARHELINLGRQAQDVGVSLLSGQSPLMVLAQQGSQIADVFISSGKSVGSFFTQAIGLGKAFFTSTLGIVTGIAAIGAAAVYAASQFVRASTTIEHALEEQNRLFKEGTALIDRRTSAEARSQLQAKEQTQFETLRNQIDLQLKLNKAMEEAAKLSGARATTPTSGGMPEMGEAPTAFTARSGPGMDKMAAAFEKLKAAQDAGLPGLKDYNAELAKIGLEAGTANPALANIIADMIKVGEAGLQIEMAALRAKAMADALAGVATNAQLAAVGLGSIAQFQVNNMQAEQAAAATERQAVAALQLAQTYPGVSLEVAKQLAALNRQLVVAQQITGIGEINAQHQATITSLKLQEKSASDAIAIADAQRAVSLAQVNAEAERTLRNLQEQGELIRAASEEERGRIKAAQTYKKLLEDGVDAQKAGAIAAQMQANARAEQDAKEMAQAEQDAARAAQGHARANEAAAAAAERNAQAAAEAQRRWEAAAEALKFIPFYLLDALGLMEKLNNSNQGGKSQFNPAGYASRSGIPGAGSGGMSQLGAGQSRSSLAVASEGSSGAGSSELSLAEAMDQIYVTHWERRAEELFAATGSASAAAASLIDMASRVTNMGDGTADPSRVFTTAQGALDRLLALVSDAEKKSLLESEIAKFGQPNTLAEAAVLDKLTSSLDQLTQSTDNLAAVMTDVLSPFYSTDPRRTNLGFRAFAGGGIMTGFGELPLRKYAGGGIAHSPQVAMYAENSVPEAYVPVPSGRIPVELRRPANNNDRARPIVVNVSMTANVSRDEARKTGFQIAQQMKRSLVG